MPLDPDCLARLKLRQPPFDASPSEEFLYSDPLLESLIETASRAMTAPGAIVILAGAKGSGRSIQLMRLLGALADRFDLIAFRGRPEIPFDAVDLTIRNHLAAGGQDDPSRSLTDLLRERGKSGAPMVLAIDDANFLGMETIQRLLRMRSEILESKGQGLRLILVGDPALSRGRLPLTDPADENQVVRLNLRPFNLEQAGAYLRHRLRVAGIDDPESFLTSGDIAVLQTNSRGIPSALNEHANSLLARRCRSAEGFKQARAAKPTIEGLVPAAAAAREEREIPDRVWPDDSEALPVSEEVLDDDADEDVYEPSDPQLSDFLRQEDRRDEVYDFEQILKHVRQHELTQKQETPSSKPKSLPAPGQGTAVQSQPFWNRRWFIPAIVAVVVLAILGPVAVQLLGNSGGDRSPSDQRSLLSATATAEPSPETAAAETSANGAEVPEKPVDPAAPDAAGASLANGQDAAGEGAADETAQPTDVQPSDDKRAESEGLIDQPSVFDEDDAWLSRQDSTRLTIQLIAARDLDAAREFVRLHQLSGAHYVRTRSFVIVVLGSFPNRSAAKQILSELPEGARSNGPWIRTIASVIESR